MNATLDVDALRAQLQGRELKMWSGAQADAPVVQGMWLQERLASGLDLHASWVAIRRRLQGQAQIEPGLKLIVMLQSRVEMQLGREWVSVGGQGPECLLLAAREADSFLRTLPGAGQQKQLVLSMPSAWFSAQGLDAQPGFARSAAFCQQQLAYQRWVPDARQTALVDQLLDLRATPEHLQALHSECLASELALSALTRLHQAQAEAGAPASGSTRAVQCLLELLHSGAAEGWTLAQMARAVGTNPTTLQRQFRAAQGCSVFDYLRRYKLGQARQALLHGATVTQAALDAGYGSPANFATAFKRQFGQTPRTLRPS